MEELQNQGSHGSCEFDRETMILDAELARDILFVYADEVEWPSRIGPAELGQRFEGRTEIEIIFHLKSCQEAGLLDAQINRDQRLGSLAPTYYVGFIDGLTL